MKNNITLILLIIVLGFSAGNASAQLNKAKKESFSGKWYNKIDKRMLTIQFDTVRNCFIINDYTKGYSEDSYYAYLKNNKLVIPAENSDHHSAYCEISIVNKKLFYECNGGLNFKDNFLRRDKFNSKLVFESIKKKE